MTPVVSDEDPHGFIKRSLRMTPVVSDEILTRESTVQDDSIIVFMENCIYRIENFEN